MFFKIYENKYVIYNANHSVHENCVIFEQ
jgi:hypothetical protein